jgi:hypothetical protein
MTGKMSSRFFSKNVKEPLLQSDFQPENLVITVISRMASLLVEGRQPM